MKPVMTLERARELVSYDPNTGVFTWNKPSGPRARIIPGGEVGCVSKNGYREASIDSRIYKLHRVAWLMTYGEWPDGSIDHINGDRLDNRVANLRIASTGDNSANRKVRRDNHTGAKGVRYLPRIRKYNARICKGYRLMHIGVYDTLEEAKTAYDVAARQLFGEFAARRDD